MKNIIIMGPPGSGKDTQIEALADYFNFEVISGGDVARALGEADPKLKTIINDGGLINDDLVLNKVSEIINDLQDEKGIVFDGFPRDLYQAEKLAQILISYNRTLDGVVYIDVSEENVVKRLEKRRICAQCGINIPVGAQKCVKCGGRAVKRGDDEPAVIINRMQVFLDKTTPLISYYKNKGILLEVDGEKTIKEVTDQILERLGLCQIQKS